MAYDIGAKIGIEGEKSFKQAITSINKDLGVLGSEMKKVSSEFKGNESSIESLTEKDKVLNKQLETQKEKIEAVKKALENSKEQYGENDNKTKDWQKTLNNAEADLYKLNNQIDDNKDALEKAIDPAEDMGDEIEKAGDKADKSGGKFQKLGGVLKASAVAMGAVAVAAGAAAIKLGKEVIEQFGEYEQLVGGVDTLFKDSSGKLQEYASGAYKTAGMSANDYMENVTGFSASLIQSLGGDTEKAVEYADMAITDMSDNANKMGSDIGSIQTAYQGFAKQNYTMLDNLKLGYGGTKTEMERLLADAGKISGFKYDVSSYADVVDAIHVMQESMGIAGTTALEAEETIQGSISSMGSAWSNWLVGLGRTDADMKALTGMLVDSFQSVLKNITPVIRNIAEALPMAVDAMLDAVGELLPDLLDTAVTLFRKVLDAVLKMMPELIPVAVEALMTIVDALIENIPMIIEGALTLILALADGVIKALPELIPAIVDTVITIVDTLIDNIDMLIEASLAIIVALADGLIEALPRLIEKAPVIIDRLIRAITDNMPLIISTGVSLIVSLGGGLIKAIPQLLKSVPEIISSLAGGLEDGVAAMAEVGLDLVKGLWSGISDAKDWLLEKVTGFGKSIENGIKKFFGIKSPSTLFRDEIGKNLALGLGEGFVGEMDNITKDINNSIPTDFEIAGTYGMTTTGSLGIGNTNPFLQLIQSFIDKDINISIDLSMVTDGREWAKTTIPYTQPLITEREMRQNRLRGVIN